MSRESLRWVGRAAASLILALVIGCGSARAEWAVEVELSGISQNASSDDDVNVTPQGAMTGASGSGRVSVLPSWGKLSAVLTVEDWWDEGLRQNDPLNPYLVTHIPVNGDLAVETHHAVTDCYATYELFDWGESPFTVSMGRTDVSRLFDRNKVATDPRSQFVHAAFRRSAATEYPGGTDAPFAYATWFRKETSDPGARGLGFGFTAGYAVMDEDTYDQYYFTEFNFAIGDKLNAGVFGWVAAYPHVRWASAETKDTSAGFGLCIDGDVTDSGNMSWFVRSTLADQHVQPDMFKSTWSVGFDMRGTPWRRSQDTLGVAYGLNVLSEDYAATLVAPYGESDEGVLEVYYRWMLLEAFDKGRPTLEITPHIQSITGANTIDATAQVVGVRVVSFLEF